MLSSALCTFGAKIIHCLSDIKPKIVCRLSQFINLCRAQLWFLMRMRMRGKNLLKIFFSLQIQSMQSCKTGQLFCALQTESGTKYCTLRPSKSHIWHFFRGWNLAFFGSKNLYLVINGQYWQMKFPAETDSYLNCFKMTARWWFFHFDDQPPQVT